VEGRHFEYLRKKVKKKVKQSLYTPWRQQSIYAHDANIFVKTEI
jgi:hypothetical protein